MIVASEESALYPLLVAKVNNITRRALQDNGVLGVPMHPQHF